MLPEYDFRGGVRGKYAARYAEGTNVVVLDPEVAAVFPDAIAGNDSLRALAEIARRQSGGWFAGNHSSITACFNCRIRSSCRVCASHRPGLRDSTSPIAMSPSICSLSEGSVQRK